MASIGPLRMEENRMYAYSQDLRDRVLRALERGDRPTAIADRFEVSRVWVYQVRNRLTQTGQRGSLPSGGHRRSRLIGMEATLRAWLKETGDLTLAEMCARLAAHGIAIKVPALWHQLDKWKLTLKKPCTPASKSAPTCKPRGVSGRQPNQRWISRSWCFSMKPGRRRTWRGATDAPRAANVASAPCLTAIGTPPLSSPDCGMMTSPPRWWRMAP